MFYFNRTILNYLIGRAALILKIFWSYTVIRSEVFIHLLQGTLVCQPLSAESDNVSCSAGFLSTTHICPSALKQFHHISQADDWIPPD